MSSSRPEGAKQLLDPERLISAITEKEILVEKHSYSQPSDYKEGSEGIKPDCSLLSPANLWPRPGKGRVLESLGNLVCGGQLRAKQYKGV